MEENKFRNKSFVIETYKWPIDLYYGKPDDVKEFVENKYKVRFDNFDSYCGGYTAQMEKKTSKYKELNIFFFISSDKETCSADNWIHSVHHEAIHTAWFILDYVGVKIDAENHEALTYLESHIASKVYEQILKWKKEDQK